MLLRQLELELKFKRKVVNRLASWEVTLWVTSYMMIALMSTTQPPMLKLDCNFVYIVVLASCMSFYARLYNMLHISRSGS